MAPTSVRMPGMPTSNRKDWEDYGDRYCRRGKKGHRVSRTPDENELTYSEVLELQTLLESLGMRPGFLDGIPGPRTAAAIKRYEESRGQPQTENLDRELLKRLRQEPK